MTLRRLADLAFLLALTLYILLGTSSAPFHGDESTLIYMSRDYAYQFIQRDLDLVRFHDPPISATEQELRLLNGTVSKYLYGVAWHLGGFSLADVNEQWDWGADWNYNQSTGHAPSAALLQTSRIPSALLLAVGAVAVFAIGKSLGGRPVAYLAALYYALNPALLLNGRRAMMEGSQLAFSLLAVLFAVWLLQKPRWWVALLLGIASGLALASKHSAAFNVVAVFAACALYPFVTGIVAKRRPNLVRPYALLLLAGIVTLLTFYVLNPAWWGDPLARASYVLNLRADLLAGQTAFFGGYPSLPDALTGFFRQVFVALPQYYEIPAWSGYIADQIAAAESSIWRGVSLGGSLLGGIVLLLLTLLGFAALTLDRATPLAVRWLVGIWALGVFITTALLTPLEWQRYYIPAYPAVGLLAAYALVRLIRSFGRMNVDVRASNATESS